MFAHPITNPVHNMNVDFAHLIVKLTKECSDIHWLKNNTKYVKLHKLYLVVLMERLMCAHRNC